MSIDDSTYNEIEELRGEFLPVRKSGSFDTRHRLMDITRRNKRRDGSPWNCVSPMTQHVLLTPTSPARIRRSRSRSFNDYIDRQDDYRLKTSNLILPGLMETSTELYQRTEPNTNGSGQNHEKPAMVDSSGQSSLGTPSNISSTTEKKGDSFWICALYGMINATIVLPVLMSFGSIIYRNEAFGPYMPVLIKLTLVSGVVHQICFSTLSSLPFAVGQVQDAGLIFLSAMASDMVGYCRRCGYDDETLLATVTVGLATATTLLGVGLVIIGKLKLAGYVQMLPTCVVGGYLAFIGWFCGISGVTIMVGQGDGLSLSLLCEQFKFVLPGILGGIFIYTSVRTLRHVAVLPVGIIILLVFFYIALAMTGSSIEQATEHGWIRQSEPAPVWYHSWDYLRLDKVDWSALPRLLMTELGMIFVVALSSSLDVAAIELELNEALNYNHELKMIGISNMVSGLTGGYTGSYIFSQSIFTLRAGIRSRLAGFVLAFCQIVVITTPFPVLSYVPNFFYGSLLTMICVDLMYEWLWLIRDKVTVGEYCICLATFGLIQILGVEYGIAAGVAVYVLCRRLGIDVGGLKMITSDSTQEQSEGDGTKSVQSTEQTTESGMYIESVSNYGSIANTTD